MSAVFFKSRMLIPLLFLTGAVFAQPSLLPLPQEVKWNKKIFPLKSCKAIIVNDSTFSKEAGLLKEMLRKQGFNIPVKSEAPGKGSCIRLEAGKVNSPQLEKEAYSLTINSDQVLLTANTSTGIFNGLQTLVQLINEKNVISGCEIRDWPAFSWRGYMIDVGRNYMSMELLKQQIDIMSRYKLNIFHFILLKTLRGALQLRIIRNSPILKP